MESMRLFAVSLVCASVLCLGVAACGGGSGGTTIPNMIQQQPSPSPSPALPTSPPAPTPTPMLLPSGANGITIGTPTFPSGDTSTGGQGLPVDGIDCAGANTTYHIHAHVTLFHNGVQIALPLAIGIMPPIVYNPAMNYVDNGSCFYNLHTHDSSGIVHIENPSTPAVPFTLGQVFDIWGQPLSRSNIAGFMGPTLIYTGTVLSGASLFTGDPRTIPLSNHLQITLEVGGPYVFPPFYTWTYNP